MAGLRVRYLRSMNYWDTPINLFKLVVDAGITAYLDADWSGHFAYGQSPRFEIVTYRQLDREALKKLVEIAERNRLNLTVDNDGRARLSIPED
jgi:hypothetical protein